MSTQSSIAPNRKLRRPEAAAFLGISPSTLAKMALRGDGPLYSKCGPRICVYDLTDLEIWLSSRKRASTSAG